MDNKLSAVENQKKLRKEKLRNTSTLAIIIEENRHLTSSDMADVIFNFGFKLPTIEE